MQQPPPRSLFLYPLGKLHPIIPQISQFLTLQNQSTFLKLWYEATNEDDLQTIWALAILQNQSKLTHQYNSPLHKDTSMPFNIKSRLSILHCFFRLTKNNNQINKKVAIIICEILSYYYHKFPTMKDSLLFCEKLSCTIDFITMMLQIIGGTGRSNLSHVTSLPEYNGARKGLQQMIEFIYSYDLSQSHQSTSIPANVSKQLSFEIHSLFDHVCSGNFIDVLLSTLIYIKLNYLQFFEFFFDVEIKKEKKKSLQMKKKLLNTMRNKTELQQPGMKQNLPIVIEISLIEYINVLYRQSLKFLVVHKLLFSHMLPLLYFMPTVMMRAKSTKQRDFLLNKLFIKIFDLLNRLLINVQTQTKHFQQQFNITKVINQRDFIRAFSLSNVLNDIELAMVGFEEDDIRQHKDTPNYKDEYQQVLEYFRKIHTVKNKIIASIDELYHRFAQKWSGWQDLLKQQLLLEKGHCGLNTQQQTKSQLNIKPISLSIYGRKQQKKKRKHKGMDKIEESSEEDLQTVYGADQSIEKRDQDIDNEQTEVGEQNSQEDQIVLNLKPLVNNRQHKNSTEKHSIKYQSQEKHKQKQRQQKNNPIQYYTTTNIPVTLSTQKSSNQIHPRLLDRKSFITYYQNHSNPYNSLHIFRQPRNTYLRSQLNNEGTTFTGQTNIIYPDVINTEIYKNTIFSPLLSSKLNAKQKFTNTENKNLNDQIRKKRTQIMILTLQIIQKEKQYRKSGKNTKSQHEQQLWKLQQQKTITQKEMFQMLLNNKQIGLADFDVKLVLFPLADTLVGKNMHFSLTLCLQQWMKIMLRKKIIAEGPLLGGQDRVRHVRTRRQLQNPFWPGLFALKRPYQMDISYLKDNETTQYFLALLFDFLLQVSERQQQSQRKNLLQEFNKQFFVRLQQSHRTMLIYYIVQVSRQAHFNFTQITLQLIRDVIENRQIVGMLRFMTMQLKLHSSQMQTLYQRLYERVSKQITLRVDRVVDKLENVQQLVKLETKLNYQQNFHNSSRYPNDNNRLRQIDAMKKDYYCQLQELIEAIYVWLVVTYGVVCTELDSTPVVSLVLKHPSPPLLFHCPVCQNLQFVSLNPYKPYSYQQVFCSNCPNNLLYRFELQSPSVDFIKYCTNKKNQLIQILKDSVIKLKRRMEKNQWSPNSTNIKEKQDDHSLERTRTLSMDGGQRPKPLEKKQELSITKQSVIQKVSSLSSEKQPSRYNSNTKQPDTRSAQQLDIQSNSHSQLKSIPHTQRKTHKSSTKQNNTNQTTNQQMKQKHHHNHQYCYNSERILLAYLDYVLSLVDGK